jgi:hypothetical protein
LKRSFVPSGSTERENGELWSMLSVNRVPVAKIKLKFIDRDAHIPSSLNLSLFIASHRGGQTTHSAMQTERVNVARHFQSPNQLHGDGRSFYGLLTIHSATFDIS